AGARRATDDHEPRRGLRDEIELRGVDEAGDVREMLVGAPAEAAPPGAELARLAVADLVRAERRALAAGEPDDVAREPPPAAARAVLELEDALGAVDAPELAVADRDRAARQHHAFLHAPGDLLLVLLALAVAVEDARDGRVA